MTVDAQHVIEYATRADGLNYSIENIIIIGRSLGTGVAIGLGSKYPSLKSVVVISPYTSIRDVAMNIAGSLSKLIIPNVFHSFDIIDSVKVPMLFIHGIKDDVIPYAHSVKLHEKCGSSIKHLELREAMDHNRCKLEKDIFLPIEKFLVEKLQIDDLPAVQFKPLDYQRIFGGEGDEMMIQRSNTSSIYGLMTKSQLTITAAKSESLPTETNVVVMTQSAVPSWKTKLQVSRSVVKKSDSDNLAMGSMFKCPL